MNRTILLGGRPWRIARISLGILALTQALPVAAQTLEPASAPAESPIASPPQEKQVTQYKFQFDEFLPKGDEPDPLAGRTWGILTEVDPVLDDARRVELLALLNMAKKDYDLHFMVITAKGEDIGKYPPIAIALLRERLSTQKGGVLVVTDSPGTQLTAYTTLLETYGGAETLAAVDRHAFSQSAMAMGSSERAVTLVKVIIEDVAGFLGLVTPAPAEVPLPSAASPVTGTIEPSTPVAPSQATNSAPKSATPAASSPAATPPPTKYRIHPPLIPWLVSAVILLQFAFCIWVVTIMNKRKAERTAKRPQSGLRVAQNPRRKLTPVTSADAEADPAQPTAPEVQTSTAERERSATWKFP